MSEERSILERLDRAVRRESVRRRIDAFVRQAEQKLEADARKLMAWEVIPLAVYREALSGSIRSSWVFVLRAGAITGAERHPNSHQRMMSYRGAGDFQTGGEDRWESHRLVSDARAGLSRRWISIPPKVWHQAIVPDRNWVVVSFHTVPAGELIEERADPTHRRALRQRRYLEVESPRLRQFRRSDVAPVRRLILRTVEVCYAGVYPPRAIQFFKRFHSKKEILVRSRTGHILVAERHGVVVATGALVGREILGVFVAPRFQGCGYGRALMRALEARAARNGHRTAELSVSLPSKGFYRQLGYRIGEACSLDLGQGQHLRFWKATKQLQIARRRA